MTEQNNNLTPTPVATTEQAIEYITNALTNGELRMKEACHTLGWSFPRIRSRSLTIAKKMKCIFKKIDRGVYILDPIDGGSPVVSPSIIVSMDKGPEEDEPTLDAAEVEKALLNNGDSMPNIECIMGAIGFDGLS